MEMSRSSVLLVLLLVAAPVARAQEDAPEVLELNSDNFGRAIDYYASGGSALLVEFYAPWCGHCQSLEPKYEEAAARLAPHSLVIAKLDAEEDSNREIAEKYGVKGFPTLKFFKDGGREVQDYDGKHEADDIVQAVIEAQGRSWQEVKTKEEVDEILKSVTEKPVFLFHGKEPRAVSKAFSRFKITAEKLKRSVQFLGTFEAPLGKDFGLDPPEAILFTNYNTIEGERKEKLTKFKSPEAIEAFLGAHGRPLTAITSHPLQHQLLSLAKLPILHMMMRSGDPERKGMYRNRMTKVAGAYKDKLAFAVTDEVDPMGSKLVSDLELDLASFPTMIITKGSKKYIFSKTDPESLRFKAATIRGFADDFLAGKAERIFKSQPLPGPPTDDEPVQVIVAKNFEEIVMDKEKHVLLELYTPWCEHCQALEPKYKEAAKIMRKLAVDDPEQYGNIVIAKMDASANDIPRPAFDEQSFPNILFVKAGRNKIIRFEGEREADSIVAWIKSEIA